MVHLSIYFVAYILSYALIAIFGGGLGLLAAIFCNADKAWGFRLGATATLSGALYSIYVASSAPTQNEYVFVQLTACLVLLAMTLCLPWRRSPIRLLFTRAVGKHRL